MNNDRFKIRTPWYLGDKFAGFQYWEFEHGRVKLIAEHWESWVSKRDKLTAKPDEQCTGLKDKNGNLIYEGDLLGGLPVVWVNELNGFRVKINTIQGWDWHYVNEFTNQEITGNIHEQAEQKDVK